jgi:indole-3-glycerol phosphate synthase
MSILEEIFATKKLEVAKARQVVEESDLEKIACEAPPPSDFIAALRDSHTPAPRLIAEVKKRSPSRGTLRPDLDPSLVAQAYAGNGASAISVLTDEPYFGGSLSVLREIADLGTGLPLLRKDFLFDRYQLLEARACGASGVLLIAAMLDDETLSNLIASALELGLTPLVEAHSQREVERALACGVPLIGINNRDLHTFQVDLERSIRLRPLIPPEITVVAESGIRTPEHVGRLADAGVDAMLVGESLVTAGDIGAQVRSLVNRPVPDVKVLHPGSNASGK